MILAAATCFFNKILIGAADWGPQGFVAHGSHALVVVTDSASLQVVQVLDGHGSLIVCVKWYANVAILRSDANIDPGRWMTLSMMSIVRMP